MSAARTTHSTTAVVMTLPRHLEAAEGDLFRARSLALAESRNLLFRSRWLTQHDVFTAPLGATADGIERFEVPSLSRPGETHLVEYEPATQTIACVRRESDPANAVCAGHFEKPCAHVGSVVHWLGQVEAVLRTARDQIAQIVERADQDRWDLIDKGQW